MEDITFSQNRILIKNFKNPWNNRNLWHSFLDIDIIKNACGDNITNILEFGSYDGGDGIRYKYYFPNANVFSIEASPNCFNNIKFLEQYDLNVFNYAINDYDGFIDFYETYDIDNKNYAPCGSINKDLISFKGSFPEHDLVIKKKFKIECIRIDTFCNKLNIEYIDLIHIDTEGSELNVLNSFGKIRPKLIYIEVKSDTHDFTSIIKNKLNELKYVYVSSVGSDQIWVDL